MGDVRELSRIPEERSVMANYVCMCRMATGESA